jgi:glycosyltransferase involved in cell wall biosynthesis
MNKQKLKILLLSDHALSTSGVGCQSRFLMNGLIEKGCWTVRQFGAALKHNDYAVSAPSADFIIKPIDGFGNPDMLRVALASEKPDVLMIFTDPRFFTWLWAMEDEIHQVCPIAYWHVWDNYPNPEFNKNYYASTDLINCHSHLTYDMVSENFPERTNFIPHALPDEIFYPLSQEDINHRKREILGPQNADNFVLFWVNRNAKRKRPSDVIAAWKLFIDKLDDDQKKNVTFIMHTDPFDPEGPNLVEVARNLGVLDSIQFSSERLDFDKMNTLHNISDVCINMAYAEGFGLATLEAMKVGNPIIAAKTGGLTRQVVDHRDNTENGVGLDIKMKTLVGSQNVPYIYEDYASIDDAASAIYDIFSMPTQERTALGQKARSYVQSEFSMQGTIDAWHNSLTKLTDDWAAGIRTVPRYSITEF